MTVVKAHALGNDFLLIENRDVPHDTDRAVLARTLCARHRGIGADGLIFYAEDGAAVSMQLLNADGSHSEISGNGVRCLAAWIARRRGSAEGTSFDIATDAGSKRLRLTSVDGVRATFRAAMGPPADVTRRTLDVDGVAVDAITLRVGNPQCVVLGEVTEARLHGLASKLAVHDAFAEGTNVELAEVVTPGRVRILIWERGVGPTEASGTGACAAAVAAIAYGGADRQVDIASPGGVQRVEWLDDGLYLTGWAEVLFEAAWLRGDGR
jgi:diaminopimelate epimerase